MADTQPERRTDPVRCPTCDNDGPGRRRSAVDLSLCPDSWHERHPLRWKALTWKADQIDGEA